MESTLTTSVLVGGFVVVPEVNVGISYWFTSNISARVGYIFLLLPDVARAGDQIDLAVNPNLIPPTVPVGPPRPAFTGKTEDLWLHALSFGLEVSF